MSTPTAAKPFKILVGVKRVIDYAVRIRFTNNKNNATGNGMKGGLEYANVKHSMNPFDEIAVEEALRIKANLQKANPAVPVEIIVASCGAKAAAETLRTALAMGADRAIHIELENADSVEIQNHPVPLAVAKILKKIVEREEAGLVLLGKQAIDDDCNQTGQMLAGLLNWPQATFASKVIMDQEGLQVTREIDGGLETLKCPLPALLTTDLRLNEPRYATLPNIMKAKSKPLARETLQSLGLAEEVKRICGQIRWEEIGEPGRRKAGVKVASVDELVDKLRNEAGVL